MCKKLLPAVLLLGLSVLCMGQNQVPEISNVSVKVDPKSRTAFIKYDLADQEDDDLTVYLTVSEDNGKRYLVDTRRAQGDLGEGIAPGKDKKIVWEYGTFNAHISMIYFRIVADDGYRISVDDIMKEVEEDRIRDDLARLTLGQNHQTEEGHKGLYIVRDDIEKSYQTAGLDIQTQKFSFGGYNGKNIIGKKAGIANEKDNYIVFAHYDSREAKIGSVVNMSGIVGVLESMRILSKYNFKKSIRWAAFDLSYPEYMGSSFYVWKDGGFPKDENIEGGYFLNGIGSDIHQPGEFLDVFKIDERDQWLRE
ncbi:MAG: M28 family peptidase, partial [Bacteroidota bacterium]